MKQNSYGIRHFGRFKVRLLMILSSIYTNPDEPVSITAKHISTFSIISTRLLNYYKAFTSLYILYRYFNDISRIGSNINEFK